MNEIATQFIRLYHLIRHELGTYRGSLRFFLFQTILLAIPIYVTVVKWDLGWIWVVSYVALVFLARKETYNPKHMQIARDGYSARKAALAAAIFQIGVDVRPAISDKDRLRSHALDMIVSYVRGFRSDDSHTKIFSCLLTLNPDTHKIQVKLRDNISSKKRESYTEYDCSGMLAERCFLLKEIQVTGNVKREFPVTPSGKEYNSILCIPIFSRNSAADVVAVVSIDSTEYYHFDTRWHELYTNLFPYIALIAISYWDEH